MAFLFGKSFPAYLACGPAAGPTYAMLDGTPTNATLSGGNLMAAHNNISVGGARSNSVKNSGLYYFEATLTAVNGLFSGIALLNSTAAYSDYTSGIGIGTGVLVGNGGGTPFGDVIANGAGSGFAIGALTAGSVVVACAVDFTHSEIWFKNVTSGGLWNGNATANPATTVNGATISGAIGGGASAGPAVIFAGNSSESVTINFGATAFSGTVPSGFTSGWPA
jgi:hypothetical protein